MKKITNANAKQEFNGWYVARLVGEIGYIIAIPLVVFLIAGQYIDRLAGTKIAFTLIGMLGALVVSTVIIYRKIKEIS